MFSFQTEFKVMYTFLRTLVNNTKLDKGKMILDKGAKMILDKGAKVILDDLCCILLHSRTTFL